ncbi:MAG: hypothetical protein ACRDMV_01030, partial [Streptosporangiales bacterium]
MVASAVIPATRYFRAGIDKCYFLTDIAATTYQPDRSELDAGQDISKWIMEINGFTVESANIETPDLASEFTSNIPGPTSVGDSSLTLYASKDGVDARSVFPRGTDGFMVFLDGGDTADNPMDVFPVRVGSLGKVRS